LREEIVMAQAQLHLAATLDATLVPAISPAFYHATQHLKSRLKSMGASVPVVLPPIIFVVLDQAAHRGTIGRVALRLRQELAPHREAIQTLYSAIGDPTSSVEAWEHYAGRVQRGMAEVTKGRGVEGAVGLASVKGVIDFAEEASKGTSGALTATLKQLGAAPIARYLKRRDVMFFSFLEERFSRIRGYQTLLDRHFEGHVSERDIDRATSFIAIARDAVLAAARA
jgi:hypothetical protein